MRGAVGSTAFHSVLLIGLAKIYEERRKIGSNVALRERVRRGASQNCPRHGVFSLSFKALLQRSTGVGEKHPGYQSNTSRSYSDRERICLEPIAAVGRPTC